MCILKLHKLSFLLLLLFVSSCVSYRPKEVKTPSVTSWKAGGEKEQGYTKCPVSEKVKYEAITPWWQVFEDEALNQLEEQALKESPTIELAFYKMREAQELYISQRAYLFPFLDLNVEATRYRQSKSFQNQLGTSSLNSQGTSGVAAPVVISTHPANDTGTGFL